MRRTAVDFNVPLLTNIHLVKLFCESVAKYKKGELLGLQVSICTHIYYYYYDDNAMVVVISMP